jgi:hypothetical protein
MISGMQNVEDLARNGLELVKERARRGDRVGQATYRTLELVSTGLGATAKALSQLGDATQPPTRTPAAAKRPAAKRTKTT